MIFLLKCALCLSYALLLTACASGAEAPLEQAPGESTAEAVYRKITAEEARAMMESGEDYLLLDVRTEAEYGEARIDGAVLLPGDEIADRAAAELPDKDARILVYCRSGVRSANAAQVLADAGYTQVYDFGGLLDWPYETVSD